MAKAAKGKTDTPAGTEKEKAIDMAISQIERQFGRGSIMRLGSDEAVRNVRTIPSGSLGLDIATGVGGIP
ncbi:MAG: hypothetical protein AB1664_23290, partial [Thermodesulfobacteriota bacterium]